MQMTMLSSFYLLKPCLYVPCIIPALLHNHSTFLNLKELYLRRYNDMLSVESQLAFQRNMSPPFSGGSNWYLLHIGFLLGLFFNPEDEGDMFRRNVG
jgi:hypothetical protein